LVSQTQESEGKRSTESRCGATLEQSFLGAVSDSGWRNLPGGIHGDVDGRYLE